jgi:hypothetical protein
LGYDCVEETLTKDTTLNGLTFAAVVECAAADLILDNFDIGTPGVFAANTKPAGSHPNYIPGTTITPYAI